MSIKDGLRSTSEDPGQLSCIRVVRDYGDWEIELDVCIEL